MRYNQYNYNNHKLISISYRDKKPSKLNILLITTYVLILTILLTGCTNLLFANAISSSIHHNKNITAIQVVPLPTMDQSKSVIILLRQNESASSNYNYTIVENKKTIGLITNNSYLQWESASGNIDIIYSVKPSPTCNAYDKECVSRETNTSDIDTTYPKGNYKFEVEAGKIYYLRLTSIWTFPFISPGAEIIIVDKIDLSKNNAAKIIEKQ